MEATAFNHLVGVDEDRCWHGEGQGLGPLEIDGQLELPVGKVGECGRLGSDDLTVFGK
jgi:hypothetical protein